MIYTCHVTVRRVAPDFGGYTNIVCEDLDTPHLYYMVTRLPNWECPVMQPGDQGFLKYQEVTAGESTWYDKTTDTRKPYLYDNDYLVSFVLDTVKDNDIILLILKPKISL